ncbi:hypothetical protein Tco_1113976 [Tanacetum coccineum]|uniref:Retrotransposon gag domain-containing protein n=1 Tax=Tanacetum coccineum TaxID=301880 RepID=A0ABQ5ITR3_9ASTR
MATIEQCSMLQAPIEGYEGCYSCSQINANNLELSNTLINLVQSNKFTGRQDPHNHLRFFNKVTSTFRHPEVPNTSVKLLLFPFSLDGEARDWLDKEPPTFNEAWERFKGLLRQCPHHGFSELHQLDTFYNSLNSNDQDALDSAAVSNFLGQNASRSSSPVKTSDNIEKFTDELAPLNSLPPGNDDSTLKKEFHEVNFQVYSNPLLEFDESFKSSNVNPLFEENNKDVEIKSSSSITLTSPQGKHFDIHIDPILEEFAGELAHIALIPLGIVKADFDPDDDTSNDDDDFEDIEYVSLEEVNDVDQEEKEFNLEDIFQIQDVILREKLLNVHRLISNIKSLKVNSTPDRVLESPSPFPIPVVDSDAFFEESDTSFSHLDNSLPEFETFSDHSEETRSGNTTTHANYSLPEYESFYFDNPSIPRPPPEPPDIEKCFEPKAGILIIKEFKGVSKSHDFMTSILPTLVSDLPFISSIVSFENEDTIFDPGIVTFLRAGGIF